VQLEGKGGGGELVVMMRNGHVGGGSRQQTAKFKQKFQKSTRIKKSQIK
jgi:hypothetical protein